MKPRDLVRQNLRYLRLKAGMTQDALAYKVGIHRTYVGIIERGEVSPTVDVVGDLATALGVTINDMFRPIRKGVKMPAPLKKGPSKGSRR